jgi:hypothetical protein
MHGNVSPRARRRIAADRRDGAREDALRLLEPKGAEEDEEMTAGLAKATSNDAHSATRRGAAGSHSRSLPECGCSNTSLPRQE